MIDKIESCLVTTCKAIGIEADAVFPKSRAPEKIGYDPSAQYEVLDTTHKATNPWVERKKLSATNCQIIKIIGEISVTVQLSFISVSENTLENLLIDYLRTVPKTIAWDNYSNIAVLPQQSFRGDYVERVGDPVDYKELVVQTGFKSNLVQTTTEKRIKVISVKPVKYISGLRIKMNEKENNDF